ncbi:MAG: hypothetical protein ACJAU1_000607 [Psychromonas sp.]|jgi:hypothetical protein
MDTPHLFLFTKSNRIFLQNIAPPEGAVLNNKMCTALGTEPSGSAVVNL